MSAIRRMGKTLKDELVVYRAVLRHPDTPKPAKFLLGLALAYLCMPFDLIPDWIPVIGLVDDVLIVPALAIPAMWMIPARIVRECRTELENAAPGALASSRQSQRIYSDPIS